MTQCAFRYNGHKCLHPRHENHEYCVFHLDEVKEKRDTFVEAFYTLISDTSTQASDKLDMRGFIFPDIKFTETIFTKSLEFQSSHFYGDLEFVDSSFEGNVDFSECTFHGRLRVRNCKLHHEISFRKSNVLESCDFSNSKFFNEASFSNTKFHARANFPSVEFLEKASFRKAEFLGDADFKHMESKMELDFKECNFRKEADFSSGRFEKLISIRQCQFGAEFSLKTSVFDGEVSAEGSRFAGPVSASAAVFKGKVNFPFCSFREELDLSYARFGAEAMFDGAHFLWTLNLNDAAFNGRLSFHNCEFSGRLFARHCVFSQPAEFRDATFHDEIDFSGSRFRYIKNPSSENGVNLDHAVLEDSHFWGTDVLNGYTFRDAFLLSLNLSNKQIQNCDFTGAVVSGVNTRNWQPDESTKFNTRYVYSNYEVERVIDNNEEKSVYRPDEDSRVPAEGEFGRGEHENYTIQDYLKSLCVWSLSLRVPRVFRKAFLDYINFFSDYARATEMVNVEIRTRKEGSKLRVEFVTDDDHQKQIVEEIFPRYLGNITPGFGGDLEFSIRDPDMTSEERDALIKEYQFEIATLRQRLESKIQLLKTETEKNEIMIKFGETVISQPAAITNMPVTNTEEAISVVHIDISDYSRSTGREPALYSAIQRLINDAISELEQEKTVEAVRNGGDGLMIFVSSSETAMHLANDVLHQLKKFNRRFGNTLSGARAVIGFGVLHKEQRGEAVTFTGKAVVEIVRIDQPMKHYIEQHDSEPNFSIWCTREYADQVNGKVQGVSFDYIADIELDKGAGVLPVFRVKFA